MDNAIIALAKKVKILILDVDGVLTDGRLQFNHDGEFIKTFHAHDGLGIKLLLKTGVDVALITARVSPLVTYRAQMLGIKHIYQGQEDKIPTYEKLLSELHLTHDNVAYVGDDLNDIPLLRRVALPISVANARPQVQAEAKWVTKLAGGHGAVREICDGLMEAQGTWENVLAEYTSR